MSLIKPNLKNEILREKNNKCELCNSKNWLEIHHVDLNAHNNSKNNLKVLCKKCHSKWHKKHGKNLSKSSYLINGRTIRVSDKTFKVLKRLKISYAINTFNDAITALIISQGLNQKVIK